MKLKLFFVIVCTFPFLKISAQDSKVCFQAGYGFYQMNSLKDITQKAFSQLPFEAKIISNYPPYLYYQPMIKFASKNFEFGFLYLFQTTGSRISSKDYSGEYKFDTKINCGSPGIILNGIIRDYNTIKLGLSLKAGVNFSKIKFSETLQLDTSSNITNYNFTANSAYFEPGIYFVYPKNRMSLELNIGYYKEVFRNNYSANETSQGLIPVKKSFVDSDIWDGLRIGITFSYILFKKSDNLSVESK